MTREQIEEEAKRRYIVGSASYVAFILGAEYVLNDENNE